jgi:hypothetical protein
MEIKVDVIQKNNANFEIFDLREITFDIYKSSIAVASSECSFRAQPPEEMLVE